MSTDLLVVPLVLVTGSLHFVSLQQDARAEDVVKAALEQDGLRDEVLGDLEDGDWALQRIRTEQPGRAWEEDELLSLGDGEPISNLRVWLY